MAWLQDGKAKRKVGRPIAYCGDPFSPHLEPEQRRVILRRIANRESARRVRARRQDELERLSQRVSAPLDPHLAGIWSPDWDIPIPLTPYSPAASLIARVSAVSTPGARPSWSG